MKVRNEDVVSAKEAMEVLRLQKHDFLNYMQIINGYLQLGNTEKALGYVKKATVKIEESGAVMNSAPPALGIKLLLGVHNAYKRGLEIELSSTAGLRGLDPNDGILESVDIIFRALEEMFSEGCMEKQVEIDFVEEGPACCLDISFIPVGEGLPDKLEQRIRDISGDHVLVSFGHEGDSDRKLQVYFSNYSRSG